jgi:hypothetical protein
MSFIKLISVYNLEGIVFLMVAKKDVLGFINVQNIVGCQLLIVFKALF